MALLSELDLPVLDYTDPALRGPGFHPRMAELARPGLAGGHAHRRDGARPRGGEVFLRSRSTTFPGRKLAELFGIETGPLAEELRRNILCIDGDDHRRLRNLVNPAFTPRAADRWRPAMRTYLEQLWDGRARRRALRVRRGLRQALPVAGHRDGDGRAPDRRAAAAPLVQLDPEAVRRRGADDRARADRGGGGRVLRLRRRAAGRPPRRPRRGPRLDAAGRRGRRRPPLRRRVREPRAQRPHRRRRHDAVPARPRHPPARRASRPVGSAARRPVAGRRARSRRRCATSRSRRSPRASWSRTWRSAASPSRRAPWSSWPAAPPTATASRSPTASTSRAPTAGA